MKLSQDWKKVNNAIGHACVAITAGANAAWQEMASFQQYISAHWLAVGSGVLLGIAFIAHVVEPGKSDAANGTQTNVSH
jgi:diacylglycerol kinase